MDNRHSFGFETVADGAKQPRVNAVFSSVASRYDLMNDLMSGALHRAWKEGLVSALSPPRRGPHRWQCLDVAGGTGDIALRIAERSNGFTDITVADINTEMLEVGRERALEKGFSTIKFEEANAEELPYEDGTFDAYTIAFGIRNVPDIPKALREAQRVLRTGGKFLCLEFSDVDVPVLDSIYDAYSFHAIPAIGGMVTGDSASYRYLVESIRQFPNKHVFADMIRQAGFSRVSFEAYSGGITALHTGVKI